MNSLSEITVESASQCVNNWKQWSDFGIRDPKLHEGRFIFYTSNRDSGLLEKSNERIIKSELDPFTCSSSEDQEPDVLEFGANHWAVGYVDGFSVRVYQPGTNHLTPAFLKLIELSEKMDNYPCLDEDDYSQSEYQATLDNIKSEGFQLLNEICDRISDDFDSSDLDG